jgi:CheY-like chemotaxis protein
MAGKTIFLAEDDVAIQDAARLILERGGYSVQLHHNGDTLIDNTSGHPDLFILDKQLPGIDGLDICRHLKTQQSTRHIPVIILSANPHIGKLALLAGADDFLEKPFQMKALRDMVAKHMKSTVS